MAGLAGKTEKRELNRCPPLGRRDPRRRPSGPGATNPVALTRDQNSNPRPTSRRVPPSSIPLPSRRMRAFNGMRRLSSRQTSDEALEPKPLNRSSSPFPPAVKRNELRCDPAALPGSRLSQTRDTTKGSEELKFRIQAESHANHRFLSDEVHSRDRINAAAVARCEQKVKAVQ